MEAVFAVPCSSTSRSRSSTPRKHCHCSQCRKHTGTHWSGINVRRSALHVRSAESVRWYQSSAVVQRGFCSTCGSTVFWNSTIERT
ncbi:GFA family protein [Aquabacterium humicola]|uniref:GFA family protein n=1 Tax=Aquabacterium humicola TaxID=3237377 RepID=UPI0032EDD0B0